MYRQLGTLLALGIAAQAAAPARSMIGYFASWQIYDRSKLAAPANFDFSKWTRVNFAFLQTALNGSLHGTDPEADGQVLFGTINWYDPTGANSVERTVSAMVAPYTDTKDKELQTVTPQAVTNRFNKGTGLIDLAHAKNTEVFTSIGGWSLSSNFPSAAAGATTRTAFAHAAATLVRDWQIDGIDIDWEYPGYADHHGTSADGANYKLLLSELRDSLDKLSTPLRAKPGLTIALPCGPGNIAALDVPGLAALVDEMNLMTYDFHGAFDAQTNHNSGLFPNGIGDSQFTVKGCVDNYVKAGAPKSKLNIGSGFYGRSFAGATTLGATHAGNDLAHWPADEGMPMYYSIAAQSASLTRHWDSQAQVPWASFAGGGLVTYEDTMSVRIRGEWLVNQGLKGVIVWEMSGDLMADKSTPLADALSKAVREGTTTSVKQSSHPVAMQASRYEVFDAAGHKVFAGSGDGSGLARQAAHLPHGLLLVRSLSSSGELVRTHKVVLP